VGFLDRFGLNDSKVPDGIKLDQKADCGINMSSIGKENINAVDSTLNTINDEKSTFKEQTATIIINNTYINPMKSTIETTPTSIQPQKENIGIEPSDLEKIRRIAKIAQEKLPVWLEIRKQAIVLGETTDYIKAVFMYPDVRDSLDSCLVIK